MEKRSIEQVKEDTLNFVFKNHQEMERRIERRKKSQLEEVSTMSENNEKREPSKRKINLTAEDIAIKEILDNDPQRAFLSLAMGAFNEGAVEDFDYLAGMAMQYSGNSILTEIALTLLKTLLIIKTKYPECVRIAWDIINNPDEILKEDYYIRLHVLTTLIFDMIDQEKDGKINLQAFLEQRERVILCGLLDSAARNACNKSDHTPTSKPSRKSAGKTTKNGASKAP